MSKTQLNHRDPRGRKTNPRGRIRTNGLFEEQWKRILNEAGDQGVEGAFKLREIVDWYFAAKDQEAKQEVQE